MSSVVCVCGEAIRISGPVPNPNEYQFIADTAFPETEQIDSGELYRTMHSMFECPRSGHLWVFWRGFEHDPTGYAPIGYDPRPRLRRRLDAWLRSRR